MHTVKQPFIVFGSLVLTVSIACAVAFVSCQRKGGPSGYIVGEAHNGPLTVYLIEENQSALGLFNASWALRLELWRYRRPVTTRIIFENYDAKHDLPKVLGLDYSMQTGMATVRFSYGSEARFIQLEVGSGETSPEDYVRGKQ